MSSAPSSPAAADSPAAEPTSATAPSPETITSVTAAPVNTSSSGLLEVDPAILANTATSDYESAGYVTTTASLSSSINEYIFENGRRYHAYFGADKNFLPTDEKEQDRMDLHHEILLQVMDERLFIAPVQEPNRILDIGTGTGIWAIDVADQFPGAEVIGTDLSPIQPAWVPPNCRFEVDDADLEWTFKKESFDFIHSRNLIPGIGDWQKLVRQMYDACTPGGFVEIGELGATLHSDDGTMSKTNGLKIHMDLCREAMIKIGRPFPESEQWIRDLLINAGFVDVRTESFKEPIGPWPKERRKKQIGAMVLLQSEAGLEAYGMAPLTRILDMPQEEAHKVFVEAHKAVKNKNYHTYNFFHVGYGRKPRSGE
ncbi:S-adenosyl-L-methionine-dependent methyltransferase [Pyronema domesticum]|uniref:Similar to Trans-aconitate 2-methyltransferase acc. no. C5CSI6 n=1 Tax=Pyronema omphalodes (strain CBS 100304) TaxID=1076935 RepID=U4LU27_PYROM|nr:S-adenosyl-L-methionine-dependent methyltransferase [Pyronema domesticum]CCX33335.1 Similar to Trans-aconitate 2-methyltransferase; acc. no. C5CSI6 [Pyronema omphalodes CBS 100304]